MVPYSYMTVAGSLYAALATAAPASIAPTSAAQPIQSLAQTNSSQMAPPSKEDQFILKVVESPTFAGKYVQFFSESNPTAVLVSQPDDSQTLFYNAATQSIVDTFVNGSTFAFSMPSVHVASPVKGVPGQSGSTINIDKVLLDTPNTGQFMACPAVLPGTAGSLMWILPPYQGPPLPTGCDFIEMLKTDVPH